MKNEGFPKVKTPEKRGEFLAPVELTLGTCFGNGLYAVHRWEGKNKLTSLIKLENGDKTFRENEIRIFEATRIERIMHQGVETWVRVGHLRPNYVAPMTRGDGAQAVEEEYELVVGDTEPSLESRETTNEKDIFVPRYIVGTVVQAEDSAEAFAQIDQDGYERDLISSKVIPERLTANVPVGSIVVFERTDTDEGDTWEVHSILGMSGDTRAEVLALAYRSNTSPEFSRETEQEIEALKARYEHEGDRAFMEREARTFVDPVDPTKTIEGRLVTNKSEYVHGETRLDLRDQEDIDIYTIDPESAKDFDDAISFKTLPNGTVEIGVHIADVAHFARLGTALEKDARFRQFTRYLKHMTVPMFPEFLSNTLASLEPGKDRLAYSTIFTFNADGEVVGDPWFGRTIIRSKKRFTYKAADRLLKIGKGKRHEEMKIIHAFTERMRALRADRGALLFEERPEGEIVFDEEGKAQQIARKERASTSFMIEDLMLAANEAQGAYVLAAFGDEGRILLRALEAPAVQDVMRVVRTVVRLDPQGPETPFLTAMWEQYNELLEHTTEEERETQLTQLFLNRTTRLLGKILIAFAERVRKSDDPKVKNYLRNALARLLKRAYYTTDPDEHFSLAVQPYLHATSPIRRYPDVIIQYLMDEAQLLGAQKRNVTSVSKEHLNEVAQRATIAQQRARAAERDAFQIAFMDIIEHNVRTKGRILFSGPSAEVLDASGRGIFIELRLPGRDFPMRMRIPFKDTGCIERDGKWIYRVKNKETNEFEERSAVEFFRPNKGRHRTLILEVRSLDQIDRVHRKVSFTYHGHGTVRETDEA